MDPRTMNRRSLCKTIVAMTLVGISSPLKHVLAAGGSKPVTRAQPGNIQQDRQEQEMVCISKRLDPCEPPMTFLRGSGVQQDKQRPFICILRRQAPGTCETFLRKREGKTG